MIEREGGKLVLAGVPDYSAGYFDTAHRSDPKAALAGAPADAAVKILLAHQPRSAAAAEQAGFDLQLSGHTHGGQFLPWSFLVKLQQPFTAGLYRLGRLWVYVSRGTGYWGPPKRLGAPSEITRSGSSARNRPEELPLFWCHAQAVRAGDWRRRHIPTSTRGCCPTWLRLGQAKNCLHGTPRIPILPRDRRPRRQRQLPRSGPLPPQIRTVLSGRLPGRDLPGRRALVQGARPPRVARPSSARPLFASCWRAASSGRSPTSPCASNRAPTCCSRSKRWRCATP